MKRFRMLVKFALTTVAWSAMFASDSPRRIKVGTMIPRGTSAHVALLDMAEKWRGSGVELMLHTDGQMGGEAEMVRRIRIGQLQGALLSVAGLMEIDRSVAALQLMPMMFRSLDEAAYVREQMRGLLEKRFEEKGFTVVFWGDSGWVHFFSRKPVVRPDDLRRQKLFGLASDNSQVELMKSAGFQIVPLDYTDILPALQTGLIDAVPAAPFYALAGQFFVPAPYMLEMNYVPLVGGLVVSTKTWDSIPAAAREAMRASASATAKRITLQSRKEMQDAVSAMEKRGLKVTRMTPADSAEWSALFEGVYPRIRGNMVPADLFDEVQRLLREYRK